MKEVTDFKALSKEIMRYFKRGVITNSFLSPESMKCEMKEGNLFYEPGEDFLEIFVKRNGFYRLYFYALNDRVLFGNQVQKTVCDFSGDDHGILKNNGFLPYLLRVRLMCEQSELKETKAEKGNLDDLEEIFALSESAFDRYSGYTPTEEELKSDILKERVYIKRIDGEIAGFLRYAISGKTAEIKHLCVKAHFRRKGIARLLVSMFLSENEKSIVWTGAENTAALELYQSMGFKKDGCKSTVYIK